MTDSAPATTNVPEISKWKLIGPGIVVAATGVGAGDLLATLIAGSRFGYALLWAAVAGCIVKIALSEGAARWHLATGQTMLEGWRSLGKWTSWYFGIYILIWGFIYGAAATSATALPLTVLFPVLPLAGWAVVVALIAFVFVSYNCYAVFETLMKILVGMMFLVMIGLAVIVTPDLPALMAGFAPTLPIGSAFYTLGLIGGVGGTVTVAAYGYWVNAKGWRGPQWLPVMRFDNGVAYAMTGIFVISMLIVGAELLYSANIALSLGDRGLLDLGNVLAERFNRTIATVFLIGFAASALSSVLGVWHGVSLMFSDFVRSLRNIEGAPTHPERAPEFRGYLIWLTFPPMCLLAFDQPFLLVIIYGVIGAFFMPFLAVTLLILLNSKAMPAAFRSGWISNITLSAAAALFLALCGQQLYELL